MKLLILLGLSTATAFFTNKMGFDAPRVFEKKGVEAVCHISQTFLKTDKAISTKKIWVDGAAVFYKNETIELRFAAPNAPFLGVVDPAGRFFYLVYPKEQATGGLKPVVESTDFTKMTSLKIQIDSVLADPYTYGASENRPVFTRSGKYTFIMGENLHVDDPDELEQVVIEYFHQNRPANSIADLGLRITD